MSQNVKFKFVILVTMTILLGLVIFSGYRLFLGLGTIFWHTFWIVFFIIVMAIHIFLKKKKIYNMAKDILNKPKKQIEHSGYLVKKLKNRPLNEICNFLDINILKLEPFFKQHHVKIKSYDDSLENIAKDNDYDSLKLLAAIISIDITNKKDDNKN